MKLLVLCSRFPYPIEKGDKLRLYHQLRQLALRHELTLVALTDEEVAPAHLDEIRQLCREVHVFRLRKWRIGLRLLGALMGSRPWQVAYFFRKSFARQIHRLALQAQPDMVFCQLLRMAEYARDLPFPSTLDYMDAFSLGMRRRAEQSSPLLRPLFNREAHLLAAYEKAIFPDFDHHCIISPTDRDQLGLSQPERVQVVPNGVDVDFFSPQPQISKSFELVFVGNMGYFPNAEAAKYLVRRVLPLLSPSVKLQLAGARPTAEVRSLAGPRVTVSGWVDDIRTAYQSGRVFVAPLFAGSGQQNKILEAMAMGLPCITTSIVNQAIGAEPDREVLIAEDEEAFGRQIKRLLADEELAEGIARAGQELVRKRYSWQHSVALLEAMWP
jgi:sugar transferase (PEP-CTERM/EpsH1 system associated)